MTTIHGRLAALTLALLLALSMPGAQAQSTQKPVLNALIIDGINNHDWEAGTRGLKTLLAAAHRFRVDVSTTPQRDARRAGR